MSDHRNAVISSGDNGQVESQKSPVQSNSIPSPAPLTRKRTSSGVFKVDDISSPPNKLDKENEKNVKEGQKETEKKEKKKIDKKLKIEKVKNVYKLEKNDKITKIESTKIVKCVTAFKESDSWD